MKINVKASFFFFFCNAKRVLQAPKKKLMTNNYSKSFIVLESKSNTFASLGFYLHKKALEKRETNNANYFINQNPKAAAKVLKNIA